MLLSLPLVVLVNAPLAPIVAPLESVQDRRAEVKLAYEERAGARDAEGLATLWKENHALILQTIDADLEGGLALWEQAPEGPDLEAIAALHERALFAAEVASTATGNPIFADYAASFVGWDDAQKLSFRTGQALYGQALEQVEAQQWDLAHAKARECRERALALGDWWGSAMGYSAEGSALRGGGHMDEALVAHGQARLLYHELGLLRNEYMEQRAMAGLLRALERPSRARVAAAQALSLARALNDAKAERELLQLRLWAEGELGLLDAAAATEAELAKLGESR